MSEPAKVGRIDDTGLVPFVPELRWIRTACGWTGLVRPVSLARLLLLVYPLVLGQKEGWAALLDISLIQSVLVHNGQLPVAGINRRLVI